MSESSTSQNKSYTRGPYKKDPLYRTKIAAKQDYTLCEELFSDISKFRESLKTKYKPCFNRSIVLENLQGQLDRLAKQVKKKRDQESEMEREIRTLKERVAILEQQAVQESVTFEEFRELVNSPNIEDV